MGTQRETVVEILTLHLGIITSSGITSHNITQSGLSTVTHRTITITRLQPVVSKLNSALEPYWYFPWHLTRTSHFSFIFMHGAKRSIAPLSAWVRQWPSEKAKTVPTHRTPLYRGLVTVQVAEMSQLKSTR
jgi:hypothetical protein